MKVNFSNHFQILADTYGDCEALVNVERNRRFSYRELHLLTNQIVNMMRDSLSMKAGDFFLNILENDNLALMHMPTMFKSDITGAFTNYRDSIEGHSWQVDFVKPKVVFIEKALIDSHYPMLRERNIAVVCMDPIDEPRDGLHDFWALVNAASDANPNIVIDDREHPALMRFTGGTTGKGKPAMYSFDNWLACRDSFYALPDNDWTHESRMLHLAPISHGSAMLVLPTFYAGGCNVTINVPDLSNYCQVIHDEGITHSMLVPTLLYRLLEMPEVIEKGLGKLKTIYYGAAPMSPSKLKSLQEAFGNIFIQVYGSTEHCSATLSLSKADHVLGQDDDKHRLASAGRPVMGTEIILVDDDGQPVANGENGEIWIRSRATIKGYYQNPEKTAEEFIDGFWKSGDIAKRHADGYIQIVDRKKDMIISGGFNIYATEVEAVVNAHEAIFMSAVVGIPSEEWGETVHAEVMLREGVEFDPNELKRFVKEKLGGYKSPKTVKVVEALPVSAVGKVLRREVRDQYWKEAGRQVG
jgi:fatty-acyl-CoA synthase